MISTSYGVRFFLFAYAKSTCVHFSQNAVSWSCTIWSGVVDPRKSYVAGNRNPSRFFCARGLKHGSRARLEARRYPASFSLTG